jgi:hypothetical protein
MPRIEGHKLGKNAAGADVYAPVLIVTFEVNGVVGQAGAIVDSGADRIIMPAEFAAAVGIEYSKLPAGTANHGAGGGFEARLCTGIVKYRDWPICDEFLIAEPNQMPVMLLGRDDFFRRFVVHFNWHRDPPTFDVDPITVPRARKRGAR